MAVQAVNVNSSISAGGLAEWLANGMQGSLMYDGQSTSMQGVTMQHTSGCFFKVPLDFQKINTSHSQCFSFFLQTM